MYNIQMTAALTGVNAHSLRTWEKRYLAVTPSRTSSGHRQYSEEDILKIRLLSDLCSLGHRIGDIATKSIEELQSILKSLGVTKNYQRLHASLSNSSIENNKVFDNLVLALENFRLDIFSHEIYNSKLKLSPKALALEVISPLMGYIGQSYMDGKISIAQEHAISSILKFHLGEFIYRSYEENKRGQKLFLITTPENEQHEFGILLASLLCLHHGHNFFYLGPNLPAKSLVEAAESLNADAVILGTTINTCREGSNFLTDYLEVVLLGLNKNVDLIIGGNGHYRKERFKKKANFLHVSTLSDLDNTLADLTSKQPKEP